MGWQSLLRHLLPRREELPVGAKKVRIEHCRVDTLHSCVFKKLYCSHEWIMYACSRDVCFCCCSSWFLFSLGEYSTARLLDGTALPQPFLATHQLGRAAF